MEESARGNGSLRPVAGTAAMALGYGLPAVLVGLIVMSMIGPLSAGQAIGGALATLAAAFVPIYGLSRQSRELTLRARALVAGTPLPPPSTPPSHLIAPLARAMTRLETTYSATVGDQAGRERAAAAILSALPDPVLTVDAARRVREANPAAEALLGAAPVGRDLAMVLRQPGVLTAVDSVLEGRRPRAEHDFQTVGNPPRYFSALVYPGGGAAALVVLHDVTALRRAEAMRADFVANASHELRTPLAGLIGFIETLQGPARDDEQARERFLALMRDQARRMARLVQDLLSLSRIELNEHSPPQGRVDLVAIARRVADLAELRASERRMTIAVEAEVARAAVEGDEDELEQVIQNLVDNAIAYGRADTAVTVRLVIVDRQVALSVIDRGEGISPEHLPRLTERFYRVDSARSRSLGGTGLGLAIVKHIINRHRGSISIKSTLGEGSCFTVNLPAVLEPQAPPVSF